MMKRSVKWVVLGAVAAVLISAAATEAKAYWWGYGPYAGSWGCCSVSYDPCGGNGWYLGYRPGPIRRFFFGPYRWYAGCVGGYSCCASSCWNACYAAPSCCGEVPGAVVGPTVEAGPTLAPTPAKKPAPPVGEPTPNVPTSPPAAPAVPAPTTTPAAPGGETPAVRPTALSPQDTSATLTIWVPAEAKVTINGIPTKSTGSKRQYISFGLKPGYSYKYEVRAQIVRNGQVVEDSRIISLTAGQRGAVACGFNMNAEGLAAN